MRVLKITLITLAGPALLLSVFASHGFADDKSHKEAWSDPVATEDPSEMRQDGMLPSNGDMAPHPIHARRAGAGPMIAALGNAVGARSVEQDPASAGGNPPMEQAGATAAEVKQVDDKLDDEKILHLAHVANTGEIEQAKLAATHAQDPRVKRFAKMMIAHHSDAEKKEAMVVRKKNLNMVASKTSDRLMNDGTQTLDMLKAKSGPEFDHAYMDAQVTEHQAVLKLIDTKMTPNATDADVKTLVSNIRPTVQSHLDQAKALQAKLKD